MSDNNGSEQSKIIKTQGENGEEYNFELVDVVELDGQEYGLLVHVEDEEEEDGEEDDNDSEEKCKCSKECACENEEETEEEEVVVMRLLKTDGNYTFETIEEDEEFEKVIAYLESESEEN